MKTKMKMLLLAAIMYAATGCKKEVVGPAGPQGPQGTQGQPGPSAKTYTFIMGFSPLITSATFQMPTGSIYKKAVTVYLYNGSQATALPYVDYDPGFVPVAYSVIINELTEKITIETKRGDNQTGSPWATYSEQTFKAVCIDTQ